MPMWHCKFKTSLYKLCDRYSTSTVVTNNWQLNADNVLQKLAVCTGMLADQSKPVQAFA